MPPPSLLAASDQERSPIPPTALFAVSLNTGSVSRGLALDTNHPELPAAALRDQARRLPYVMG